MILSSTKTEAKENAVCKVGNDEYTSIKEAIRAIEYESGVATIVLIKDVDISEGVGIYPLRADTPVDITLDLAGHKIIYKNNSTSSNDDEIFYVSYYSCLRLKDSKGNGMIYSANSDIVGVSVSGGKFVMDGGTILIDSPSDRDIRSFQSSVGVQLSIGTITLNKGTIRAAYPFRSKGSNRTAIKNVIINGGTYDAYFSSSTDAYTRVSINGGVFNSVIEGVMDEAERFYDYKPSIIMETDVDNVNDICIKGGTFNGYNSGFMYRFTMNEVFEDEESASQYLNSNSRISLPVNYLVYSSEGQAVASTFNNYNWYYDDEMGEYLTENHLSVKGVSSKVSLDSCGGVLNKTSVTVYYSSNYDSLPTPTRTGYTFQGWYTSLNEGTKVTEATKVTTLANQTLYAHWKLATVKISFNPCGGKVSNTSRTAYYGCEHGNLPVPTRTGYVFLGWYTHPVGGSKVIASTKIKDVRSRTLYAHWKPTTTKITFQVNGGMKLSMASITATYNCKLGKLPSVQRKSHIFSGWFTKKSGGSKVTTTTISKMSKPTTLYAHWTKVSVNKVVITSLSSKTKKLTVKHKKITGVKGYQVMVARNSNFTKKMKQQYVTSTSNTISKLQKNTKYYIRVRAYKLDSTGNKIFGSWSKTKKITM